MLYTRKGDAGDTGLFGVCGEEKKRVSKGSSIAEALGTLDELNSFVGLCRARAEAQSIAVSGMSFADILKDVQHVLFSIQAQTAGADKRVGDAEVPKVEAWVGEIEKILPPIKSFSVPGASEYSALLDIARTLARRAERRVVACCDEGSVTMEGNALPYLNRLSSLLFAMARQVNTQSGITEESPHY